MEPEVEPEPGFSEANSDNVPEIDALVLAAFFASNKIQTPPSGRPNLGDDAISYVQIMRMGKLCTMKCKVYSEVDSKLYAVTLTLNETDSVIDSVHCHDCGDSEGVCLHAAAFVLWAHRKSEQQSGTCQSYFHKPILQCSPEDFRISNIFNFKPNPQPMPSDTSVFDEFIKMAQKNNVTDCPLLRYHSSYKCSDMESLSMHQLAIKYKDKCSETFLEAIKQDITKDLINKIQKETIGKNYRELWCELQYGRITASKAYATSECDTCDEDLISSIMGAYMPDTEAKKEKRAIKSLVRQTVEMALGEKIDICGLMLNNTFPMIVGSPDGICADGIVHIELITSEKPESHFIKDGKPTDKYYAELQILMYLTDTTNCYYCVADFVNHKQVQITQVPINSGHVNYLLNVLELFWKTYVYPLIINAVTDVKVET
ncbi:uncharacterized protein LOC124639316 [Helicoverpa zea]|uniref:uncharacterized protein LOC124639316 n=1 Tax=Helicoverpa zea TaxID=7113 RepID=UPI001F55FDE6|nr:uncharacterized protein LOC124639316 [Helicoverpa zea]